MGSCKATWTPLSPPLGECKPRPSPRPGAAGRPPAPPFMAALEDGEGSWDIYLPAAAAVQSVVRRPPGRYLIVSHGGILNSALRVILGVAPVQGRAPRFELGNCGYAHLTMDTDGAWPVHALCNRPATSSPDEAEP